MHCQSSLPAYHLICLHAGPLTIHNVDHFELFRRHRFLFGPWQGALLGAAGSEGLLVVGFGGKVQANLFGLNRKRLRVASVSGIGHLNGEIPGVLRRVFTVLRAPCTWAVFVVCPLLSLRAFVTLLFTWHCVSTVEGPDPPCPTLISDYYPCGAFVTSTRHFSRPRVPRGVRRIAALNASSRASKRYWKITITKRHTVAQVSCCPRLFAAQSCDTYINTSLSLLSGPSIR